MGFFFLCSFFFVLFLLSVCAGELVTEIESKEYYLNMSMLS